MRIGRSLLLGVSAIALADLGDTAMAQTTLPEIRVQRPKEAPKPASHERPRATRRPGPAAPPPAQAPTPEQAAAAAAATAAAATREVTQKNTTLNQKRDEVILPKIGTNTYDINREAIEALPQGENTPLDRVLLQAPGVHQDSAASSLIHIRNEHANVQYRINGILLPEGVQGLGQVLESGWIANLQLVTGALPAQYGLHTAALVDITSRSGMTSGGSVSVYGGSRQTFTPYFDYGGTTGKTEYFVMGRYFESGEGIENPLPTLNPIHDYTTQVKFFGYASTLLSDTSRMIFLSGATVGQFQIPNNLGQTPAFPIAGNIPSANLNERQFEHNYYNVAAYQATAGNVDMQLAAFSRYSTVHFVPDQVGDLVFNGVASDVYRASFTNGLQEDTAIHLNAAHTLRAGLTASVEQTQSINASTALPVDVNGNPFLPSFTTVDSVAKTGGLFGSYIQDEWRITDQLTLNAGIRFDQMWQFVDANQFSPRVSMVYKPFETTTFHAGYARNFTPPLQLIATPVNLALASNPPNTATPAVLQESPVLPERSNVFDVGIDQKLLPGLTLGIDAYYKQAKDLLDDGQFGQALVLSGFNYAKGENEGVELKAIYQNGGFRAYGNLAWAKQIATDVVSNQFLFAPDRLAFIATHWIFTDHAQLWTGSAGMSYLWQGTRFSADMIYGSGLRAGFANTDHLPAYTQVNLGVSHEFAPPAPWLKPLTLRFDVVNVFDNVYQIRNGTGIGVFASQFGPRRGYFVGLSQKF
jgi:outer membrane receptor protein involved in Fe transport